MFQPINLIRWDANTERANSIQRSRRQEERFTSFEDRVWMQWWENEEYLGYSARLVNVSRGGAMIVTSKLLQVQRTIHLFLEFSEPQIGVKATVLGVLEGKNDVHQIRLGFPSGCPESFYQAAAFGFENWLSRANSVDEVN